MQNPVWSIVVGSLAVLSLLAPAPVQAGVSLFDASLEELLNIEVTIASKRPQSASDSAAAVFVITAEDIRRSGVNSLAEAFRMAPGVVVGRSTANNWAVGIRGFPSRFVDKLLTLQDGRTLYNPIFAGTLWDAEDIPMGEIERIEIIRGPGATLWGANAVNGIINIITKNSANTHGNLVQAGVGNEDRHIFYGRHGGRVDHGNGAGSSYRVYASHKYYDEVATPNGNGYNDGWHLEHLGFRTDTTYGNGDTLFLNGEIMRGINRETVIVFPGGVPTPVRENSHMTSAHVVVRWNHETAGGGDLQIQGVYDNLYYRAPVIDPTHETLELEFQHGFDWADIHHLVWGGSIRETRTHIERGRPENLPAEPDADLQEHFSLFAQNEVSLADGKVRVMTGLKFEYNEFTEDEWQPSLRAIWQLEKNHRIWAAVAHAIRAPTNRDHASLGFFVAPFVLARQHHDLENIQSEELIAWETGYRFSPTDKLSLDLALFHNEYNNLVNFTAGGAFPVFTFTADNTLHGYTQGGELAVNWDPRDNWRLHMQYSYFRQRLKPDSGGPPVANSGLQGSTPRHMASVRSTVDLSANWEFDAFLRYTDKIKNTPPTLNAVPSNLNLDLRVGWKPRPGLALDLIGRHLADHQTADFRQGLIAGPPAEIERSVHARLTYQF